MPDQGNNPYVVKVGVSQLEITDAGHEYLNGMVTDSRGQVYAFHPQAVSPELVGAAMARLSRRPGDLRGAVLDEFAIAGPDAVAGLAGRVITQFGDDSVQRLVPIQFVVEGPSILLTKLLEWSRYVAALEQSTRYIFYDQKTGGRYRYYVPTLSGGMRDRYVAAMDDIFDQYSLMVREITKSLRVKNPEPEDREGRQAWMASTRAAACDAVRVVLPAATTSTVGMVTNAQALEQMVVRLLSLPLEEAQVVGQLILRESRKVIGSFLTRADMPDRGGATTAYLAKTREVVAALARRALVLSEVGGVTVGPRLVDYHPRDELDLVPYILAETAALPISEIERQVKEWQDSTRREVLQLYIGERLNRRHKPGRAFEHAHLTWEGVLDFGVFRDLQRHTVVDGLSWQLLSPALGHIEVPELVGQMGFEAEFRACFEVSQALYNELLEEEGEQVAQYAVLLGHRMCFHAKFNLRSLYHLLELRTGPAGHPGYRIFCQQMFEQLREVYPVAAAGMRFINQGESELLARLGAERAAAYKLSLVDPDGQHQAHLDASDR